MTDFNPIRDEKKQFTLEEWAELVQKEIQEYAKEHKDVNDYHKQSHTFDEWMGTFARYMSW